MKSDERSRVKHSYSSSPIWMLGVVYKFTEDDGPISLPKSDRGEHARGGRASSILNFVLFGGSEDDDDFDTLKVHERTTSEDTGRQRINKTRSFSTSTALDQNHKGKERSSASPSLKPTMKGRLRSFSFSKRNESSPDLSQLNANGESSSKGQSDANNYLHALQSQRRLSGHNFNRGSEPSSPTQPVGPHGIPWIKPKKPRRMSVASLFSLNRDKKHAASLPSPKLYPHIENEQDCNPKFPTGRRASYADNNFDMLFPEDSRFSSGDSDTSDGTSRLGESDREESTVDGYSMGRVIAAASKDFISDISHKLHPHRGSLPSRSEYTRPKSEAGSLRSTKSAPPMATSLYYPESIGLLSPNQNTLMEFLYDFQSRIYCCYRKEFPPIEPAFHTSDTGWGCMHRTGQSLLAQGFLIVLLGRGWRLHHHQPPADVVTYRKIIRWFLDGPDPEQYYSIHNIARMGMKLDKKIGEWFGPSTVAHALKRLSLQHRECPLAIHIASDNSIYRNEVLSLAYGELDTYPFTGQKTWKPVLIMIPIRLGTDKLNANYSQNLKALFTFPQFLGIAGGRPCRSLYFVAIQDNELLYLDPHFVRPALNLDACQECPIEDYHSTIVRAMDISEMDPSMLLGFICQSEQEFNDFCDRVERDMDSRFPFFTVMDASLPPGAWTSSRRLSDVSSSVSEIESDFVEDIKDITDNRVSTPKDFAEIISTEDDTVNVSREDVEEQESLHMDCVEEDLGIDERMLSARRRESAVSDNYEML